MVDIRGEEGVPVCPFAANPALGLLDAALALPAVSLLGCAHARKAATLAQHAGADHARQNLEATKVIPFYFMF